MKRWLVTLFFLLFMPLIGPSLGADAPQSLDEKFPFPVGYEFDTQNHSNDRPSETSQFQERFFRMLYLLALLVAFMVAASWLIKKIMKSKTEQLNSASSIKIIETRPLSSKTNLHIVEVNGKEFLLAETHTQVTKLGEVD